MLDRWKRYALGVRIAGILVIAALLLFVGYQVYDFYSDKVGFTADKAIAAYFTALAERDFEQVYLLTDKEHLSDIYGRPITKGEFLQQLARVTGDEGLPLYAIASEKLVEKGGARYYLVTLSSSVGGSPGKSRLVVALRRTGRTWVIAYPFAIVL